MTRTDPVTSPQTKLPTSVIWLAIIGSVFLVYALLGNYVALPGYLRFLERGGTAANNNTLDVVIGATKTIVWMFSFQAGVVCLAFAHAIRRGLPKLYLSIGLAIWFAFWAVPSLPKPGPWFYAGFGSLLLILIASMLLLPQSRATDDRSRALRLTAFIFFALATWEVCGLGTTGRMLHPEEAIRPMPLNLLITQSSKLMIEFVIAWSLLLASYVTAKPPAK